jgi:hypothetical protein
MMVRLTPAKVTKKSSLGKEIGLAVAVAKEEGNWHPVRSAKGRPAISIVAEIGLGNHQEEADGMMFPRRQRGGVTTRVRRQGGSVAMMTHHHRQGGAGTMTAHHQQEEVGATTARYPEEVLAATMKVHRREEEDVMEVAQGHAVDVATRGLPVTQGERIITGEVAIGEEVVAATVNGEDVVVATKTSLVTEY